MVRVKIIYDWNKIPAIFDVHYASEILGVHYTTILRWIKDREFPAIKSGPRVFRIDRDQVRKWLIKNELS